MLDLNSREVSTLLWFFVLVAFCVVNSSIRPAVLALIRAFFAKKILISVAAMIFYVAIWVVALWLIGLWKLENLKTTLVWSVTFAFATMMDMNRITADEAFYRRTAKEAVAFTALVIFVTQFFTFPLILELVIVPFLSFLLLLQAFSAAKDEFASAHKLVTWVVAFFGVLILAHAIYQLVDRWSDFANFSTLREFLVPIILSLLFLPFIFLLSLYIAYERAFARISFRIPDGRFLDYAKTHAIMAFGFDVDFLRRWAREVSSSDVASRDDVRRSIRHIQAVKKRERNPPSVPVVDGWSPYVAIKFLEDCNQRAGDYHRSHSGWFAESSYVPINEDALPNHLVYYVEGDEFAAKRLKLVLHVINSQSSAVADERFSVVAGVLSQKSMNADIESAALLSDEWRGVISGRSILIRRENWPGAIAEGYSRRVIIAVDENAIEDIF